MAVTGLRSCSLAIACVLASASIIGACSDASNDASNDAPPTTNTRASSTSPSSFSAPRAAPDGVALAAIELRGEDPMPGGQYLVLVNKGTDDVDVNCWVVHSAATGKDLTIVADQHVAPAAGIRLLTESTAFGSPDTLTLSDRDRAAVDHTPELDDQAGDDQVAYRTPDGAWTLRRGFTFPAELTDGRLTDGASAC
jgi:hypothetical protein